jgi:hypothetical protein
MTAQASPFSQYRLSNPDRQQQAQSQQQAPQQIKQQSPFAQYRLDKPEEEETTWNSILRHGTRSASRILEQIGGAPQEAKNLVSSVIDPILEPIFGKENLAKVNKFQESNRILPTSQELEKKSKKVTGGYTEPKNEWEKTGDEYNKLVGQLIGPMSWRKALGVAAASTVGGQAAKIAGFGEGVQEASKLGTTLIASMFNPKGVKNLWKGYYDEAAKHIAPGAQVTALPLENKLLALEGKMTQGLDAPTEKIVVDVIKKLKDKIQNGKIGVEELVASKRSLNEIMGDVELLRRGENQLPKIGKALNSAIKLYHNPDFLKNYHAANQAFGGYAQSRKLSDWLYKLTGGKPLIKALVTAGIEAAGGHPEYIAPTLGAGGAVYGGVKAIELGQRIMSNKTLRKYYLDMLVNGLKQNTRGAIASADKLEKGLEK